MLVMAFDEGAVPEIFLHSLASLLLVSPFSRLFIPKDLVIVSFSWRGL